MAVEDILTQLIKEVGTIGLWLQAIGAIIVVWIIFQIINWRINRKRSNQLKEIQLKLQRIEDKLDKTIKKK